MNERVEHLERRPTVPYMLARVLAIDASGFLNEEGRIRADDNAIEIVCDALGCRPVEVESKGRRVVFPSCPICDWPEDTLPRACDRERHDAYYRRVEDGRAHAVPVRAEVTPV